jgi:MFS family permease
LYVLITSLIGLGIVLCLYVWFYPHPDQVGQQFAATSQYWIWVFLLGIESVFYAVVFIPCWKQFGNLLREYRKGKGTRQRTGILATLILATLLFFLFLGAINASSINTITNIQMPEGHHWRIQVMTLYAALTGLPIVLGMILIYLIVRSKADEIENTTEESRLFGIAHELLDYRHLLQTALLVMGVIVSLIPVATAALRSILIALQPDNETRFPITLIAVYGLFYTTVLIVTYAPVHLLLAETSRKLRDRLCPIDTLINLEDHLKKRKMLDEWLETNVGLAQNLKTGVVALSPLIASLVASLFGTDIKLP